MYRPKKFLCLCLLLLLAAALVGCGQEKVEMSGSSYAADTTELALVLTENELSLLDEFPQLQTLDLSGSTCYAAILDWAQAHPQVDVRYTVALPGGITAANDAASLDLSALDAQQLQEALALLPYLPQLQSLQLGPQDSPDAVNAAAALLPTLDLQYTPLYQGRELDLGQTSLDLSQADADAANALARWMHQMTALQTVELGEGDGEHSRIPWETIAAMEAACPQAAFHYSFSLYGKTVDLNDELLDLNHIRIEDQGALVKSITACMPHLNYLDMDFCGVDDEYMADIRDSLPNAEVVWRIWFGAGYTVRTDVERILASNPGIGGQLTYENTRSLKYCNKVKYLDLGHNRKLTTIDFCAYMPDLEVLVAAISAWSDAGPLANCPKLEYAELQTCGLSDLRPLANLQNLRHLNICHDFAIQDISPLYNLSNLERLWIGLYTPVPPEQVAEMREHAPNCIINTKDMDPTREEWRWSGEWENGALKPSDRYELLREQMDYDHAPYSYCYIRNDALYAPHGQGDNTTPPEWFTSQVAEYARGED